MINFSDKENVYNLIELERVSLLSTLDIQRNLNKQILIFMKNFMSNIKISFDVTPNAETFVYLNESTVNLNKSNSNICVLNELLDCLNKIGTSNENLEDSVKTYNAKFKEIMNIVYTNTETIEKFVFQITTTELAELSNNLVVSGEVASSDVVVTDKEPVSVTNECSTSGFIENTLIISENHKKVILPYNISTVKDILLKNSKRYNCVEDVIEKLYTKPISYYKFSPISRFKEAFKLVKEREKSSTFKALSLAFELLGNYNLHPAIITACNSLDELDIYLACLDDNTLEDFHFFDIKYEIPLALSKLNTVSTLRISRLAKNKI